MAATSAVLLGQGWAFELVLEWVAPLGQRFSVAHAARSNGGRLLSEVRRLAEQQAWQMAVRHPFGRGLEEGPPALSPAFKARVRLAKQTAWEEVKVFDDVVCGGVWPASQSMSCHRCGEPDWPRRRYNTCPQLNESQLPVVAGTAHIAEDTLGKYGDYK